ncbi:TIR-like protein FxsC [Streptomyces sp. NPDC005281]|uniref:TIR-like protein FxsC n=1 Tax=Streptomyces sp. NPDC005281 TaxID=3155712 RepID=UPI0033A2C6D0
MGQVVAAIHTVAPGLDGTALADLLWLASRMSEAGGQGPATTMPVPPSEPRREPRPVPGVLAPEPAAQPQAHEHPLHERLAAAPARLRGDAVALSRAGALPDGLPLTRALRPWKRPWPRGREDELDIDATVDAYARSAELVPAFRPAPERWFGLVLVVDRSPTMQVWREVIDGFTVVLDQLGAFRTLQVRDLTFGERGPELRDGLGRLTGPGQLCAPNGRLLVVAVSDCVAAGWREPAVWRQLRAWSRSAPVALLNPLPVKLWRRTGLDLPTVRVLPGPPGAHNTQLSFDQPLLPGAGPDAEDKGTWLPIPVLSMSPHSLGRWSRTLMRTAAEGCGAVLVPPGGRPARRTDLHGEPVTTQSSARPVPPPAVRFLRTASPAAARLAELCSPFDNLSIALLHLIRQELVPEASVADMAELLVSGLFPVSTDQGGGAALRIPEDVRDQLQDGVTEHQIWQLNRALSRYLSSRPGASGQLTAIVPGPEGDTDVPAELRSFAQASQRTLELLGLTAARRGQRKEVRRRQGWTDMATAVTQPPKAGLRPHTTERERVVDNRPYFFLSYAHTPSSGSSAGDPDHWVSAFFRDLCDHIMALTDLPAGLAAGFMDREMRSGDGWPERLAENLAACRVFVPLLSPRYFTSEMCGREWYAFSERVLQARSSGAFGPASPIVPALWTRVEYAQLPDSVRHLQVVSAEFGKPYMDSGLYGLIKLNRLRDEYEETVFRLAQRIVQTAQEFSLPAGVPRAYERTPSAFKPRGQGPRRIHLTVAAPTRDTIPPGRDVRPYGDTAHDWNPYFTESTRPIAALAEELMRALDFRVTVSSLDDYDAMSEPADDEEWANQPSILLIDRWVLTDSARRRKLQLLDARSRPWVRAIVPWNRVDVQCKEEEGRVLTHELENTLPLTLDRGRRAESRIAVNGLPTLRSFVDELPSVVAHATRHYLEHAPSHPPTGPYTPRPRLMGPALPSYRHPADTAPETGDDA